MEWDTGNFQFLIGKGISSSLLHLLRNNFKYLSFHLASTKFGSEVRTCTRFMLRGINNHVEILLENKSTRPMR